MLVQYKPNIYTNEFKKSKNILEKISIKYYLSIEIINNILMYFDKYDSGFALFDERIYNSLALSNYIIYDIKDKSNLGHPLNTIILLLCELNIKSNNEYINLIFNNIKLTKNKYKIDLSSLLIYMEINISDIITKNIINSSDYEELLYIFDKYLLEFNIFINKTLYYKVCTCINCNSSNKILSLFSSDFIIKPSTNNICDNIISLCKYYKTYTKCSLCKYYNKFEKLIIMPNKFLNIKIDRFLIENNIVKLNQNFIEISNILIFPSDICNNNSENIYKLNFVIFYFNNDYSIAIYKKNEWFHFLNNKIYQISYQYLENNSNKIHFLFYIKTDSIIKI